jgi:hypothetical protein
LAGEGAVVPSHEAPALKPCRRRPTASRTLHGGLRVEPGAGDGEVVLQREVQRVVQAEPWDRPGRGDLQAEREEGSEGGAIMGGSSAAAAFGPRRTGDLSKAATESTPERTSSRGLARPAARSRAVRSGVKTQRCSRAIQRSSASA